MMTTSPRGFTLLIAIILTSVLLAVGLSLIDTAYKQLILASTAKQSEIAFYLADSALECALYYDQQLGSFAFSGAASSISCNNVAVLNFSSSVSGSVRTTTFSVPCAGTGLEATVTVYKTNGPACNTSGATTCIYSNGYSSCDAADPRRVERGIKVYY